MIKLPSTGLAVSVASLLVLPLTAGAAIATADPNLSSIVDTTCSYPQVLAALNAQDTVAASQFSQSPMTQSLLRQFLAAPPDQRQQMAVMIASAPANEPYLALMAQVFNTCNNY